MAKNVVTTYEYVVRTRKRYTLLGFIGDTIMFFITGGVWLIWVIIRHCRNK